MSRFFSEKFDALVPYVPGEQPKERKFIKLNTNESPYPPSPMAQRLSREAAGDLELYPDPELCALCKIGAEKFGVSSDEITFSNGSDEILNFAFAAYCDDKTPAIFPAISYGFYPVFAKVNRVPYSQIPLKDDFSINVDDYLNVGGTVFLANPNAPTGIALSRSEIEKIVASNPDNMVVIDEAYVDFGAESAIPLIRKYDNLLVCGTFSKSRSMAGARLGYAAASKEIIADMNTLRFSTNPYNVNRQTAAAGVGALFDDEYFAFNCKKIIATRTKTAKALKKLGFVLTDSKANFIFAKHKTFSGKEIYQKLRECGILVRHFDKPEICDYCRITVGSEEEMEIFVDTISKIVGA
ncbi:MAG: histidinol-phosphate transaminase [Clostridia bacterium]|nr:histidinol-phosphate transaminase [Clostridia bacterium]